MGALTTEQLDTMTPEEMERSLLRLLAYIKMQTLIDTIRETYIADDRDEIAEAIQATEDDDDNAGLDDLDC
jgi:hypothetical protein